MKPKVYITAIVVFIVCILAVIIPFVIQMYSKSLSENPEQWGQTGDYFGGFINPIVGLINAIVTIYIATEVHKLTEGQGDRQEKFQRRALMAQLQFDIVKNLDSRLTSLFIKAESNLDVEVRRDQTVPPVINEMINLLRDFQFTGAKAFPLIRNEINVVSDEIIIALMHWSSSLSITDHRDLVRTKKGELFGLLYEKITKPIQQ